VALVVCGWGTSASVRAEASFQLFLADCAESGPPGHPFSTLSRENTAGACIPRDAQILDLTELRIRPESPLAASPGLPLPTPPARPVPPVSGLDDARTSSLFFGSSFLLVPLAGKWAWWKDGFDESFHFANERWFQKDTYAGGADKASHFFMGQLTGHLLGSAYSSFGHSPSQSRELAVWNVLLGALVVEVGDGMTASGFSWEDATITTIGGLASAWIDGSGWHDTVGFRWGPVDDRPQSQYTAGGVAPPASLLGGQVSYSKEIYSADLKLAGLLPRMGASTGAARFLLLSMTYGSKGYQYTDPAVQQRNLGFYLGLNLRETLAALGVPEGSWWGAPLLLLAEYVRLPYTSVGYQIDLNSRRWQFDTGHR